MSSSHKSDKNQFNQPGQAADKWQKIAEENQEQEPEQAKPASQRQEEQLEFPGRQQLEDQLTAMERQANEYREQAAWAAAELKNIQWRAERDIANAHKFGVEQLIKALLPVVDGLVRGLENADAADPKVKPIHAGMEMTLDLLHKALVKFGVEAIDPAVNDEFDPKLHEAMGMQNQPGAKPNTIIKVLQRGYQLHGRVLRPAMVLVAG
jgi:molecular chaperone GrpE